jgi:hypothetical protein
MSTGYSIRQVVLCTALAVSGVAFAADAGQPPQVSPKPQGQGMMGPGMMDMMRSCQAMMGNAANMGMASMPKLPPGNEKLEAQMHAEMMQKMGEIAGRYAERIKETR